MAIQVGAIKQLNDFKNKKVEIQTTEDGMFKGRILSFDGPDHGIILDVTRSGDRLRKPIWLNLKHVVAIQETDEE